MAARRRRKSTRKGGIRKTSRRAYTGLSKKKAEELQKRNKSLRARLAKARSGNPFPHGPHLKTEIEAYAFVVGGGALNGWISSRILDMQASGTIPALPGGIKPAWALTALAIAAPAMGWVKGANGARLALASGGMAAAQASDFFQG
tara:strand:- start:312 stop:749 length:438 start_codon:yes stop_codon:yes gene_type:complete